MAETVLGWMYEDQVALGLRVYSGPETRTRADEEVVAQNTSRGDVSDQGHLTDSRGDDNHDSPAGPETFTRGDEGIVAANPKPEPPPLSAVRGDEDIAMTVGLLRPITSTLGAEGLTAVADPDPPLTHSRGDEDLVYMLAAPGPQPDETKARGDD